MDVRVGLKQGWAPKNWCFWTVVLKKTLKVPWTAQRSNQSIIKEISPEYSWGNWCWSWNSNTLATWCEELTHWKRPWCWERLKAGGKGDDREWEDWMALQTQWIWIWANSGSWWWTGRPGMLQSIGLQSIGHKQLNWTRLWEGAICVLNLLELGLYKEYHRWSPSTTKVQSNLGWRLHIPGILELKKHCEHPNAYCVWIQTLSQSSPSPIG